MDDKFYQQWLFLKKSTDSLGFYNASQIWAYEATYICTQPKNSGNMFYFTSPTKFASRSKLAMLQS